MNDFVLKFLKSVAFELDVFVGTLSAGKVCQVLGWFRTLLKVKERWLRGKIDGRSRERL